MSFFGGLAQFFGLKPKKPIVANYTQQGVSTNFKAAIVSHKIIYGVMRITGMIYELGTTGGLNEYRHIIVVLAGHELDSIGNVILNGILIDGEGADVRYAPYVRVNRHLGGAGQTADADLIAELSQWDAACVGNGLAYIALRLKYNASLFASGIKTIECDVRGRKVFDPRNQSVAWSDNWALCMRDYLTADFGMGLTDAEIDDVYTTGSANTSQEVITTANNGSQNRYTLNGVVDTANSVVSNIKKMLTAGAGTIVPAIEGKTRIMAGAYSIPTITITPSDLRGNATYKAKEDRSTLFNTVSGSFTGDESLWKKATYPQIGDAAAVAADGRVLRKVIDLPYCTDHERCQRLSMQVLRQHRAGASMTLPCKATVKEVATMDVVNVEMPLLWPGLRTFRVSDMTMNKDMTVDLHLVEDNAHIYAWQQTDAKPFVPIVPAGGGVGGHIIAPGIPVRVNGLQLAGQANDPVFTGPDAHFVWRHATALDFQNIGSELFGAGSGGFDAWFMGYEVSIVDPSGTVVRTDFTKDNFYDFTFMKNTYTTGGPYRAFSIEVRIKGQQNQLSQPAKLSVSNPAPTAPLGLTVGLSFTALIVSFLPPTDLDYKGAEFYLSTTSGFTPSTATLVADITSGNTATLEGLQSGVTYYVRVLTYDAFGKTGLNPSVELTATTAVISSVNTDHTPPTVPVLNALTTDVNTSTLTVTAWIKSTWSASTDDGILSGYFVEHWTSANATKRSVFTTSLEDVILPANPGRTYFVRVRAQDWAGNLSAWSNQRQIIAAGDVTPPSPVTGFAAILGLDKVIYTWVHPTSSNYLDSSVYVSTTTPVAITPANLKYEGRGNTFILDSVVAGTNYYAVAFAKSVSGVLSAPSVTLGPVTPTKMTALTLLDFISPLAITGDALADSAVGSAKLAALAVTAINLATGAVTGSKLAANSITAGSLAVAVGAIGSAMIGIAAIKNAHIANGQIDNAKITALDAKKITTGTLNAARIAANSISANKITATSLSSISANLGTVTAGNLIGTFITTALAPNARVVLTSVSGLTVFNANNAPTAQLKADGSGFIGAGGAISWNTAGVVTVPLSITTGTLIGKMVKTASSGARIEMGAQNIGGIVYLLRYVLANGTVPFSIDNVGNAKFNGDISGSTGTFSGSLNAATGNFKGAINVGSFTSYSWPPAGQTGMHMSANGLLAGNKNGGGKYFQIYTAPGGQAKILTNIPAFLADAQVSTLKIGANAATVMKGAIGTTVATTAITLAHAAFITTIGTITTLGPLAGAQYLQYSANGGAWATLLSDTFAPALPVSFSYSTPNAWSAGTYSFRIISSGAAHGASISVFASIR